MLIGKPYNSGEPRDRIRNKYSLHPTFAHGSTLGLYEVLIGKPYICDIITDSVIMGFFIEAEKILSVLGTNHAIEDFLWQVIFKIISISISCIYLFLFHYIDNYDHRKAQSYY